MVGGDIYAGSCALDQNLVWRPRPELPGHRTPVDGLCHIGASTHPGPGLGAGSGTLVAHELLREPLPRRLLGAARSPVSSAFPQDLTKNQKRARVAARHAGSEGGSR